MEENNVIKPWLIKVSAPYSGTDTYYGAYSKLNPESELLSNGFYEEAVDDLWDNYSWAGHYDDQWESMSPEEKNGFDNYDEFLDTIYDEWMSDCGISVTELPSDEKFTEYTPGGVEIEIVYDERLH